MKKDYKPKSQPKWKKNFDQCNICDTEDTRMWRVDFTADSHCGETLSSKKGTSWPGTWPGGRKSKWPPQLGRGFYIPWYRKGAGDWLV
ncbi:hypothetical protein CEXT_180221 [Caerostris extrusa]|uniref:Uncharacterized protein n=1 Tax=Caerostris extrusa TaxID=172846 RepID=A0AAV4Q6Z8_CAEEX|nr:hypothetical protein CEXT_180221 [Caerostris extrusa]